MERFDEEHCNRLYGKRVSEEQYKYAEGVGDVEVQHY